MENIDSSNVKFFREILKVTEKDSIDKVNVNFEKMSVVVHPSIRKEEKYIEYFSQMVIAHEFLIFEEKHKKTKSPSEIIDAWNLKEKEKIDSVLTNYKGMSIQQYKKAVEPVFEGFEKFKNILFITLGISSIFGVLYLLYLTFTQPIHYIFKIAYIILIVVLGIFAVVGIKKINFRKKKV